MSFNEGLELVISQSFPVILAAFSILAIYFAVTNSLDSAGRLHSPLSRGDDKSITTQTDYAKNDLLIGLQDVFFWFLAPLFALVSVGTCVVINYGTLIVLHVLTGLYTVINNQMVVGHDRR